jgi:hypothetical protein
VKYVSRDSANPQPQITCVYVFQERVRASSLCRNQMKPASDSGHSQPGDSGLSRRRDLRVDAPASLRVAMPTTQGPLTVSDISMGGLALAVHAPAALRTIHTVSLTFGSIKVEHKVRVLHCRRNPQGGWLLGLAFTDKPLPGSATVAQLFNAILSSAITFS